MSGSVEESTGEKQMFKISNNSQCTLPLQPIDQRVLGMRLGICLECLKTQSLFVFVAAAMICLSQDICELHGSISKWYEGSIVYLVFLAFFVNKEPF